MRTWVRALSAAAILLVIAVIALIYSQLPAWGAGALLHPVRQSVTGPTPASCAEVAFAGAGVTLRGWRCGSRGPARGTIVYLHGIGDTRRSSVGVVERLTPQGFDVIAYDSRGHGESDGELCTYGILEKRDLEKVIDVVKGDRIVLIGTSLGAAVALQAAAEDPRITTVVAAETFSDLRTVATERAPFIFTRGSIDRAFALAEQQGGFSVDAASPVASASRIKAPVLLIHGDADHETPPDHSRRVFDALSGPKRLMLVPGAGHNGSLNRPEIWQEIDRWIEGGSRKPEAGSR